jgi:threonine/homoserine/homoserine lactone efflux protein
MNLFNFAVTTILVTASGALAPGPLFFSAVSEGAKTGYKSGLIFSIAHTIVEFTLVILLSLGLSSVAEQSFIKFISGIAGGLVLLVFGAFQIRSSIIDETLKTESKKSISRNLLILGLALSALNPFFIVWWLTIGTSLILLALEFASILGVIFMYFCHVWMDYIWLILTAHFARKGVDLIGFKWYRILLGLFGIILIYFGVVFIINSLSVPLQ